MYVDPYSKNDREEFNKCDHERREENHQCKIIGKEPTKSYCTKEIFHSDLNHGFRPTGSKVRNKPSLFNNI